MRAFRLHQLQGHRVLLLRGKNLGIRIPTLVFQVSFSTVHYVALVPFFLFSSVFTLFNGNLLLNEKDEKGTLKKRNLSPYSGERFCL